MVWRGGDSEGVSLFGVRKDVLGGGVVNDYLYLASDANFRAGDVVDLDVDSLFGVVFGVDVTEDYFTVVNHLTILRHSKRNTVRLLPDRRQPSSILYREFKPNHSIRSKQINSRHNIPRIIPNLSRIRRVQTRTLQLQHNRGWRNRNLSRIRITLTLHNTIMHTINRNFIISRSSRNSWQGHRRDYYRKCR